MKMFLSIKMLEVNSFLFLLMLTLILLLLSLSIKNIHPLILGLIMLICSILISLNMNMFNKTSMYSMMMFLIIIGGFLIIFLYYGWLVRLIHMNGASFFFLYISSH